MKKKNLARRRRPAFKKRTPSTPPPRLKFPPLKQKRIWIWKLVQLTRILLGVKPKEILALDSLFFSEANGPPTLLPLQTIAFVLEGAFKKETRYTLHSFNYNDINLKWKEFFNSSTFKILILILTFWKNVYLGSLEVISEGFKKESLKLRFVLCNFLDCGISDRKMHVTRIPFSSFFLLLRDITNCIILWLSSSLKLACLQIAATTS